MTRLSGGIGQNPNLAAALSRPYTPRVGSRAAVRKPAYGQELGTVT